MHENVVMIKLNEIIMLNILVLNTWHGVSEHTVLKSKPCTFWLSGVETKLIKLGLKGG